MMGPALFELYSSNYSSNQLRRTSGSANDLTDNKMKLSSEVVHQRSLNSSTRGQLTDDLNAMKESKSKPSSPKSQTHLSVNRIYRFKYIGSSVLDKSYTLPMLPWIIAHIKRQSLCGQSSDGFYSAININLEITETAVKIINQNDKQLLLYHPLHNISKFTQTAQDRTWFSYLYRDKPDSAFTIHIFQAQDENMVLELFNKMRESTKELLHNQTGQGLQRTRSGSGLETILTYSNQYEVMYVGSIRMSQKRAHPTVIDDAIDKFKEMQNMKSEEKMESTLVKNENTVKIRHDSGTSIKSLANIQDSHELNDSKNLNQSENALNEKIISSEKSDKNKSMAITGKRFLVKVIEEGSEKANINTNPIVMECNTNTNSCQSSLLLPTTLIPNTQSLDADSRASLLKDLQDFQKRTSVSIDSPDIVFNDLSARKRSVSGDIETQKQLSLPFGRTRLGSGGSIDLTRPRSIRYQNKTMLFLIGKLELCLISTDKHKIVLNKTFSNISHCSQGIKNSDHFGIICREPALNTPESYVIHVFRCQTEKLVQEIMHSLKQAFSNAYQSSKNRTTFICETCPMNWFHRICCDVEGLLPEKVQAIILHRIDSLPSREREDIMAKCEGLKHESIHEQNELFMIVLKTVCEAKQKKHSHNYTHDRSLVEKRLSTNALDSFKEKAKNSISNTFESIFKISRTESSESMVNSPNSSQKSAPIDDPFDETSPRPRSNTLSEIKDLVKDVDEKSVIRSESLAVHNQPSKKPLLNIFMKVGSQTKLNHINNEDSQQNTCNASNKLQSSANHSSGSWRQTIFNRIHISSNKEAKKVMPNNVEKSTSFELNDIKKKRSKQQLREMWKSVIKQQIILNKMEKQNQRLKDDQTSTYDKRMKLDYEEIPIFSDATQLWDATKTWDTLLLHDERPNWLFSYNQLLNAVNLGVPRHKKGEVWLFLAEQHKLMCNKQCNFANQDIPYRQLLGQLATQQHAILVDLGRTFPKVAYYSQALGSGQLSLYNLLKAYSLYDTEVEYCQGLSFVAGILLLHMSEDESFEMMKYLLFHRGLRKQYKPDMNALQMQLYQLTRLLYDKNQNIYQHFEYHDIPPTLYAAPWFLTLFASQFPLSFVARLFDILFLMGIEAIFRVSLVLLEVNSDLILQCESFESIMQFLKEELPAMKVSDMELIFNKVFSIDIKQQLDAYEVEYRVIQEEIIHSVSKVNNNSSSSLSSNDFNKSETEKQFINENKELRHEIMELTSQIHVHQSKSSQLQSLCDNYLSTIKRLELRVRGCEDERDALRHSVNALKRRNDKLETQLNKNPIDEHKCTASDSNSLNDTPIFKISCANTANNDNEQQFNDLEEDLPDDEEEDEEDDVDDDDIDINSDEDEDISKRDQLYDNYNRTQSDASNLSI